MSLTHYTNGFRPDHIGATAPTAEEATHWLWSVVAR